MLTLKISVHVPKLATIAIRCHGGPMQNHDCRQPQAIYMPACTLLRYTAMWGTLLNTGKMISESLSLGHKMITIPTRCKQSQPVSLVVNYVPQQDLAIVYVIIYTGALNSSEIMNHTSYKSSLEQHQQDQDSRFLLHSHTQSAQSSSQLASKQPWQQKLLLKCSSEVRMCCTCKLRVGTPPWIPCACYMQVCMYSLKLIKMPLGRQTPLTATAFLYTDSNNIQAGYT